MTDKTLPSLQAQAAEFIRTHGLEAEPAARLLDLLSELGEAAKEVLKASDYGKAGFSPSPAWEDELGDVFFSLVCLANSSGVDLESALQKALAKYAARLDDKGDAGSGR
ncbi:MAG: nucleotide pyrophosphohydrolase [Anaerolineae bacterium]|nr:nucleotide pyrophosphohydrolase [Anaerolineae bacterium]